MHIFANLTIRAANERKKYTKVQRLSCGAKPKRTQMRQAGCPGPAANAVLKFQLLWMSWWDVDSDSRLGWIQKGPWYLGVPQTHVDSMQRMRFGAHLSLSFFELSPN